eukprot:jgi/Astpho2/6939/Aster-x1409
MQDLTNVARLMQQELDVKDRSYHFKTYRQCFVGSTAVQWLLSAGYADDAAEAVQMGNDMLNLGLLHHVKHEHAFENRYLFYRFHNLPEGVEADEGGDVDETYESLDIVTGSMPSTPGTAREASRDADTSQHSDHRDSQSENVQGISFKSLQASLTAGQALQPSGALHQASLPSCQSSDSTPTVHGRDKSKAKISLRGTNTGESYSLAQDVTRTKRRLGEVSTALADHTQLSESMFDTVVRQLRLQQREMELVRSSAEQATSAQGQLAAQIQLLVLAQVLTAAPRPHLQSMLSGSLQRRASLPVPPPTAASESSEEDWDASESAGASPRPSASGSPAAAAAEDDGLIEGSDLPQAADFEGWRDAPVLLRLKPGLQQRCSSQDKLGRIPLNSEQPIEFETDLFKGQACIWIQGLPSTPPGLFKGKQRKSMITVQGRFKQRVAFEDCLSGQEFARPARDLPPRWLVESVLIKLAQRISPSMEIGPLSAPFVLAPVVALAQSIHVAAGEESAPDIASLEPEEDMTLLDKKLVDKSGKELSGAKRKKLFWSKANRAGRSFTPEHVWTICMYQHFVDLSTYELDMVRRFDLSCHLDSQPLQFMMKDR